MTASVDKYLKIFGASGFPKCLDTSLEHIWDAHAFRNAKTPRDRVISVLGFLHLLKQSGLTSLQTNTVRIPTAYNEILIEDLTNTATDIAKQLLKYRLIDVLSVVKSKITIVRDLRNTCYSLRLDLCFEPKRKESLDMALSKLEGLLYIGKIPQQFQEKWKKLPVASKAKSKSALLRYTDLMATDSVLGRLPLYAYKNSSIYAMRAANDILTIRVLTTMPYEGTPWLTPLQRDRNLKSLFTKAFSRIVS